MKSRLIVVLALAAAVVGLLWLAGRKPSQLSQTAGISKGSLPAVATSFKRVANGSVAAPAANEVADGAPSAGTNLLQRLLSGEMDLQLTPEQTAEYLRQFGTNVETLLATQKKDYIRLAAELFPNDPRVQYAVIAREMFPEARREWLDRFKTSAPDNALASYLSAREYLKSGDRDNALKDLGDAASRPHYNDYTREQVQNMEDAQLSAGRSILESKVAAGSGLLLPQLAMLKGLSQDMQAMQKEYIAAGDTASAVALAQLARPLAQQLSSGEGSQCLINQLVGVAIERIVLSPLPPDSQPPFLNGTVQQRIDELTAFRQNTKTLTAGFNDWAATATENEVISYFDRMKVQGEYKAMLWLKNRQALR